MHRPTGSPPPRPLKVLPRKACLVERGGASDLPIHLIISPAAEATPVTRRQKLQSPAKPVVPLPSDPFDAMDDAMGPSNDLARPADAVPAAHPTFKPWTEARPLPELPVQAPHPSETSLAWETPRPPETGATAATATAPTLFLPELTAIAVLITACGFIGGKLLARWTGDSLPALEVLGLYLALLFLYFGFLHLRGKGPASSTFRSSLRTLALGLFLLLLPHSAAYLILTAGA
ncbi:hypothetical protein [Luteolibacter soli]|uniref:Uncharacterized protein n=1 Tax=Luteolibacter soli TaxID=3135280 RepID=A0ABU9AXX5_9BACT